MVMMMVVMSRKPRVHLWCLIHVFYLMYTLTDACPGRLTCALLRREPCPSGSRACGPCRALHTLGAQGHCVSDDRRHRLGLPGDDSDEEEFIASVLSGAHTTTTTTGGDGGGDGDGGGGGASEPRAGEQRRGGKAHGQHLSGASPPGAAPPGAAVSATAWREPEEGKQRGKSHGRDGDETKEESGRGGDARESRRHRAGRRGKAAHGEVAMSGGGAGGGGGGGDGSTPRADSVWRIDAQKLSTRHEIAGEIQEEEEETVDVKTLQQTRGRGTGGGRGKKPDAMTISGGGGGGGGDGGGGGGVGGGSAAAAAGGGGGDGTSGQNSEPGGGGSDVGADIASKTTKEDDHEEVVTAVGGDGSDHLGPEISKPLGTVAGRQAASKSAGATSPLLLVAAMVSTVAAVSALVTMAACWYRLHRAGGMVQKADYRVCSAHSPGSQRPPTLPRADSRLAHRAQLYHYQQKRQQLMAMDRETEESQTPNSLTDSENEEGDITVYECPGLAPTGEMEVNNPLFDEMRANSPSHTPGR